MRPSQMGRLRAADFRFDEPTPFVVVPRGKRGRLAAIPLVGDGLHTAREFVAQGAYGRWSCASANKTLRGAARRAGRTSRRFERLQPRGRGVGSGIVQETADRVGWQGNGFTCKLLIPKDAPVAQLDRASVF